MLYALFHVSRVVISQEHGYNKNRKAYDTKQDIGNRQCPDQHAQLLQEVQSPRSRQGQPALT